MANFAEALTEKQIAMIAAQPVFFVATAAAEGRINLSPKGYDAFRVLSPTRVAYLDLGGSGNETHAHLAADGRITVMFCNFLNPALILRIYGRAVPVLPQDDRWHELAQHFTLARPEVVEAQVSSDGTRKWLIRTAPGIEIETVYIPEEDRGTLCVSSQVGCGLNCTFCSPATPRSAWRRYR